MRGILLTAVVFGLLPLCLIRPYIGVLVWSWLGYMNPQKLTWGFTFDFPFVQLAAMATLIGFAYQLTRKKDRPQIPWSARTTALLILWLLYTLSTVFALNQELSWPAWSQVSKTMILMFVTLWLIDDARKLRYLILVVTLSIAFYGFKGGLFAIATGGKYMVMGPGGMIGDNNSIGLALNMVIPSVYYLSIYEKNKLFRMALKVVFLLSIIAVVFTYSRGALLGLFAVLLLMLLKSKLAYKVFASLLLIIALPFVAASIPDSWYAKMNTTTMESIQQDGSAMNRFRAWETSWNLAKDRPFTGGGFNAIHDVEIYDKYWSRTEYEGIRVDKTGAHSVYFELLGENGLIAFAVFMYLMLSTMWRGWRSHKLQDNNREDSMPDYGPMISIGVAGYAVSGAFMEHAGFDLFYHLVVVMIIFQSLQQKERQSEGADFEYSKHQLRRSRLTAG